MQFEKQRGKKMNKNEQSLRVMQDTMKCTNPM